MSGLENKDRNQMDMNKLGSFPGASYRGTSIIRDVISTEADKASNRLKYLVEETECSFSKHDLIRPSPAAFGEAWKETRVQGGTAWGCLLTLAAILALTVILGVAFVSVIDFWKDGSGDWFLNLLCAGAFGLSALGFMVAFACAAFGAAQMLSRGFSDTWRLRNLGGQAWYIGDRALHTTQEGWGSRGSKTIFYDAMGAIHLDGRMVEIRGRDGSTLASITEPSGCGMDAAEIVSLLRGKITEASRR